MNELDIHDQLLRINNIHHSLNETNIMTYIILLETNKSKLSKEQILWINCRIDVLTEKQRLATEESFANIDVELAKLPLSCKTTNFGMLKEDV